MGIKDLQLSLTLCRRELRGGLRGFGVFLGCLFLGVLAISAVGSLGRAFEAGLAGDAKAILGGDVSVSLTSRSLSEDEAAYLGSFGEMSRILSTRTMARADAQGVAAKSVLVEFKGVDALYPLYGRMELEGGNEVQDLFAVRDGLPGAVADRGLLTRLQVAVGDEIRVGDVRFALRGIIEREPDRVVEFFSLGPRLMVSADVFAQTGLTQPGSLFRAEYLLRLDGGDAEQMVARIRADHPDSGWRVRDYIHAAPRIRTVLERLSVDLTLIGLGALLVGGLGIAGGVRGYLGGRLNHMAAMKCMGGSSRVLFISYLAQVLFLGFVGACAGMLAGSVVPWLAGRFFSDVLPIQVRAGIYFAPLIQAALFGLVTTLAFSMPPLFRAVMVRPSGIFRGYISADMARIPRAAILPTAAAFVLLALMVFWFAGNNKLAAWFVGGTIMAFVLFKGLARIIRWLAARAPRLPWPSARIGVANIHRPGSPGVSLVFALGFGLTALVAVVMVNSSLTRALTAELAEEAPDFFFMDIRPDQVERFRALANDTPGLSRLDLRPMIRGRIVRIGDTPVENATVAEEVAWAVRGDRGLSYSEDFPRGSTLLRGQWWESGYAGPPLISLTSDLAQGFGVDLGDTLTVNVLGRNLTGTITSIREVDWRTLAMQFAIIFSPNTLDTAPQTWLGAAYGVDDTESLYARATEAFPEVAVITIREVLDNAALILTRTVRIFQVMAGVALLVGFLVLAGAFSADQHRRIYDSVIYKVCGATRRDILAILVAEFSLAGLFTGLGSLALGTITAWGVVQGLLRMQFRPDLTMGLLTVLAGVGVSLFMGLLGTWRVLGRKAAPFLRNE
ncbi:putative ABC transport system permease protein [Desulfomicrobium apsheronum]|uniref:Putative ABC transport system permease protein n=1 Tax=Desulfomicrobium apsheronum TaxID=52560 RepID=A0A1I3SFS5_9BACT|nr:FtsX-like permease family protein [Desulfomicrobium apsheronum]SFJ57210.1 putative ABC transport system permease protein [Desulfomicrobium apsheronum]